METILEITGLTKKYGRLTAVNNLSLHVERGNIYGILGPNGSGKTTTLGIILGVINNYQGSFSWFNESFNHKARRRIGSILETPNFYPYLSAVKNLEIVCEIKNTPYSRIDEVLKIVNLYERKKDPFQNYSLGMKQRLALASALLSDPEVLVLDEPTNGLDPQGIAEVREIIKNTGRLGKTIIIASHILDEIEKICTHVAVIKKGNLLASGSIGEVLSKNSNIEVAAADLEKLENALRNFSTVKSITRNGNKLVLSADTGTSPEEINAYLFKNEIVLSHLVINKQSLEERFLELVNEENA